MKIIFRTDASIKIGSGHVMRCLTLAEELKKNGASVLFISRKHSGNLNHLISIKGFQVIELNQSEIGKSNKSKSLQNEDDYRKWLGVSQEQDAEESIKILVHDPSDWLIVDHYGLDEAWEKMIKFHVKNIMVIDDIANRRHDCDILLDQNWFEDMVTRYDGLVPAGCTKLLGPEYALLRPEFSEARKKIKHRKGDVNRIFIFFGGTDPYNLTVMTLRALSEPALAHLEIDAVIGENNPHQNELKELAASRDFTHLHIQVNDMASIMSKTDLAIGAGGVNTWERMCLGIPTLTISFADNHTIMLQDLVKHGYVNSLGNVAEVDEGFIKKEIIEKINTPSLLSDQSNKTFNLVNGNGSQILTDWLIGDFSNKNLNIKYATYNHAKLFWEWSNDKRVRKNAINKEPIKWEEHINWFNYKLKDGKCCLYLIFCEDKPIGQVRFDDEGGFARIDYSIAKQFRGRNLGKRLLGLAIKEFQKHSNQRILGEVLPRNTASGKTFESLGFNIEIKDGNKIYTI